jgi:putative ABC transport system permease protein
MLGPVLNGIRIALGAIRRNVLRTSLTVLGILIGVWAVVSITALGAGVRDKIGGEIQALGSNTIIVFPQSGAASGNRGAQGTGVRLTEEDMRAISREAVSVAAICPNLRARGQVVAGDKNASTNLVGTTLAYFPIRNWKPVRGSVWSEHDETLKTKVALLGKTVAEKLYGDADPVGQMVRIGRYPYRVIGVLDSKGEGTLGDQDDLVIMPISSFRARIMKTPPGFAGVLLMSATSAETSDRAVEQIDSILRQRHHIEQGREPDFVIRSQKEFQAVQGNIFNYLTILLVLIAGISLIVGGIGIMNIMLVSVAERTREIGIRMAIGARENDVRTQFLVEAVVLALLGGLSGALLGIGTVMLIGKILSWEMHVNMVALVGSMGMSAAIGIAFGFMPAHRAARLDPITALRHE